jgi:hypothetical protein
MHTLLQRAAIAVLKGLCALFILAMFVFLLMAP